MPRDVSGNYSLTAGNPVASGTIIESTWANTTLADLSVEMTDSLSRSGKGGMTAAFKVVPGGVGSPGLGFTSYPQSGLYAAGANDVRVTLEGVDSFRFLAGALPEYWTGAAWAQMTTTTAVTDITDLLAPKASPALTGNPTAPTPATSDNDTSIATTAYVKANAALKANLAGSTGQAFNIAAPSADTQAIRRTTYAASTTGGTVKMRVSGTTLYIRNDGTTA